MSDSPGVVVRRFLAAYAEPSKPDVIATFFADDGVYVPGPLGVHRGIDAIRSEFQRQAALGFDSVTIDVKSLLADDGTVMTERVDGWSVEGTRITTEVAGVFEVSSDGRITRFREYFDFKSITDQMEAAGIAAR
jgi:limonene-1,2-epoxide hydrolase